MSIQPYGILKGKPVNTLDGTNKSPHYQIQILDDNNVNYRIAVNIKSVSSNPDLLYYVDDNFTNAQYIQELKKVQSGITQLDSTPGGVALDYVRGGLFNTSDMIELDKNIPQALDEIFDAHIKKAMQQDDCVIYALGQYWLNQEGPDQYFGFSPEQGIHDIHMNQGNYGNWEKDNGCWQDGGIFIYYPNEDKWVAYFMAFLSQTFNTDNNGNPID